MEFIADLCKEFDALCFTDEIYEHIIYSVDGVPPADHISMATLPGMRERTRTSMVALARISDGRPRADDFARPLSPEPRNSLKRTKAEPHAADTASVQPRRTIKRWAWAGAAVVVIGAGALLVTQRMRNERQIYQRLDTVIG